MHALEETDRIAVLLRYFENKSLREVGQTLGTNEDAARKRVSRAVDRLREFFAKRGVTIGASGLVIVDIRHRCPCRTRRLGSHDFNRRRYFGTVVPAPPPQSSPRPLP